jgi:methylated-DNA-[protein]-cysteine S-methyltransferase
MDSIAVAYWKSPFGELKLAAHKNNIVCCDWRYRQQGPRIEARIESSLALQMQARQHPLFEALKAQLTEYADGIRTSFDIPIEFHGTVFQKKVWRALMTIPYGHTWSYARLARELGGENLIRAVAAANGANSLSILVPCHRVVGADGSMRGYAGGIELKRRLLRLERAKGQVKQDQLRLF